MRLFLHLQNTVIACPMLISLAGNDLFDVLRRAGKIIQVICAISLSGVTRSAGASSADWALTVSSPMESRRAVSAAERFMAFPFVERPQIAAG